MSENRTRSADDLIIKTENEKLGKIAPNVAEKETQSAETPEDIGQKTLSQTESDDQEQAKEATDTESEQSQEIAAEQSQDESSDNSNDVDDYGNKVEKAKLYTEEEVQAMIRKRLRDRHTEQTPQQQQQIQEAAKDFKADPASDDSWEVQLEQFVEKTITKVADKHKNEAWQKEEQKKQEEFEDRFTKGVTKYKDFESTVSGKPITTSMMMATRSMDDPAAFIYAACKQQPKELERIAKIADPYAQIAEIARLEERMKKAKLVTTAPKPGKKISSDSSDKMPERSIDQLIASHAKDKIMNRR